MSERSEKSKRRKPYQKPQLSQVELLAEEAVLAGCKTVNQNVGMTDGLGNCDLAGGNQCHAQGS
jgi:hypothetical protein